MAEQARQRFSMTPVVAVHIMDEDDKKRTGPVSEEQYRRYLTGRFNQWSMAEKIFPLFRDGSSGPGSMWGYYSPEDAKRIKVWLLSQNATEVPEE